MHAVAGAAEGLSITNLGSGRDRMFIRGVADSPFNGFSQSTVSVMIDDARVTYDAPEPGLRLVDVEHVEVLKGPQGPLYGTGALGGVVRIVTNRPVIGEASGTVEFGIGTVQHGAPSGDESIVVNLPVAGDLGALRVVGYAGIDGGWVTNVGGTSAINASFVTGTRSALRILPAAGWTIDVSGIAQRIEQRDSQYVDLSGEGLSRSARPAEPSDSTLRLASAAINGVLGGIRLSVDSSYTAQDRAEDYSTTGADGLRATAAASLYHDRRAHRVFDQEVRLASVPGTGTSWIAGISYLSATTAATGEIGGAAGSSAPIFILRRAISETAVFADVMQSIAPRWRLGIGGRLFRATTDDERREDLGLAVAQARASLGFTPSASFAFEPSPDHELYLRFASAFRPGGLDPTNAVTGRYDADEVRSLEAGTRLITVSGHLAITADVFGSTWMNVQSDYLEPNGLLATRTAGDASILGTEMTADLHWRGWHLLAGLAAQRARLIRAASGSDLPADPRLPVVPDIASRLEFRRGFSLLGAAAEAQAKVNYVGRSRLSFDPGLDRGMGGYATIDAGFDLSRGASVLHVGVSNLLDTRANTYSFGNPFLIRTEHEYTPLRPRTIVLSVTTRPF